MRLQKLMAQKRSKKYYAEKLGITTEQVANLLEQLKKGITASNNEPETMSYIAALEENLMRFDEDLINNTAEVTGRTTDPIKSLEELIEKCKIDTKVWNIDRYIQNYWGSHKDPHWQVKAFLSKKTKSENFQKEFVSFLKSYKPKVQILPAKTYSSTAPRGCLIINKQDQHFNKFDINGQNSMEERFQEVYENTRNIAEVAAFSHKLEKIYYVIGSDQFNAEWTGTTTRGTKMENIDTFHNSFEAICNHELGMLNMLRSYSKEIEVMFVSGNHDEHVGWHLITWLKAMFRSAPDLIFETSPKYRKYARFGKNALMFNHGDAIKPPKLANIFPIEFSNEWSKCNNYYIFTGDKHHEITMDFHGIMFFQLPALSKAKSFWDDKQGHTCTKGELVAFLIDEKDGVASILKRKV